MARKKKEHVLFDRMERVRVRMDFKSLNQKEQGHSGSKSKKENTRKMPRASIKI
ncbi:hypothetical protein [Fusibacter sp. JL216-2]|uniref:hypothetical protein n=1 Tax=Fusibacter sp. JL216-2 TaxID=3071453 RepID=UPI003D324D56